MAQGNISEFTSPVDSLRPTEVGVDAYQQAGAKANRIFTELGASHEQTGRQVAQDIGGGIKAAGQAAEDYIDHQQLSRGIASKATIIDTLGQTWDNAVKDAAQNNPNSTTTADAFKQNVLEPELEAWGKGFTTEKGQLWYQEQADRIREHFNTVTAAGMGQLAAHGSSVDLKTAVNGWNNTAMRDPGQVPLLLDSIPKDIKALVNSYPGARGIDAVKIATDYTLQAQEGAVKGGMFGAVQKAAVDPNGNPAATAQWWLKKYPQFITEANAEHVTNISLADQKARVAVQQRQEKDTALAQTDKYVQDAASPAPKLSQASIWTDPAYANRPDLRAEAAGVLEKMRSLIDKTAAVDPVRSMNTLKGLMSRMILPDGDPNKITDRQAIDRVFTSLDNPLAQKDYTFALGQLKALKAPQFKNAMEDPVFKTVLEAAKARMVDTTLGPDPIGTGNYANFVHALLPQYVAAKAGAGLPPNALDFNDPTSMIRKTMAPFVMSSQQKTSAMAGSTRQDQYMPMINEAAQRYGIDPALLARQTQQESGFQLDKTSPTGAAGISQFMPATAKRYGVDVTNPKSSIEGQAHYMSDLLKQFNGNRGLALAGYNWGEDHVAKWLAAGADVNKMPAETQNYVQAITGSSVEKWASSTGKPPVANAQIAPDGNWYVHKDGKYFKVN